MSAGDGDCFYEREAEYYGFTPFQLLDRVGEAVVAAVFDMFSRLERDLGRAAYLTPGQATAGLAQWSALVEARFGRNYEFFEAYIVRNVLCLPDTFVPPHRRSEGAVGGMAVSEDALSELLLRKRALLAEKRLLAQHIARISAVEERAVALETAVGALRDRLSGYGPFEQTASALGDHVRVLQSIASATLASAQVLGESRDSPHLDGPLHSAESAPVPLAGLEAELAQCQRIATLADLQFVATVSSSPAVY